MGSALERFEFHMIRIGNIRVLPDPLSALFALLRNIVFQSKKRIRIRKDSNLHRFGYDKKIPCKVRLEEFESGFGNTETVF